MSTLQRLLRPRRRLGALAIGLAAAGFVAAHAAADPDRREAPVRFAPGASSAEVAGKVQGRRYVDHTIVAAAGQTLEVSVDSRSGSLQFNVLPPGSSGEAMFADGGAGRGFSARLPDDGRYTVRVYLVRAAARRGDAADYRLRVAVTGRPLPVKAAAGDATIPGTRFHARTVVPCQPAYSEARECTASVVRRGTDAAGRASGTVVLGWKGSPQTRRILFEAGTPVASDARAPMTATREGDVHRLRFGDDERFDVPEMLLTGG